jgi:hypothetical protein
MVQIAFRHVAFLTFFATLHAGATEAGTFTFGGSANGINGQPTADLAQDDVTLHLEVSHPAGGVLNEPEAKGLGVDSRPAVGIFEPTPGVFNLISDGSPLAGTAESIVFSFDRPGRLTGINFDGVKDEALEYFILESADDVRINFFDSLGNISVPGAVDAAALPGGPVTGEIVYLLEINSAIDDEAQGLNIPFAAGQEFRLTYAELPDQYGPTEAGNGARLQGITVVTVPEPAAWLLALGIGLLLGSTVRLNHPEGQIGQRLAT